MKTALIRLFNSLGIHLGLNPANTTKPVRMKELRHEPRFLPIVLKEAKFRNNARTTSNRQNRADRWSASVSDLFSEGCLGLCGVGYHDAAFPIFLRARLGESRLSARLLALTDRMKHTSSRNLAKGVWLALKMLADVPRGRMGIVIITSGASTSPAPRTREMIERAIEQRIGVHVIQIGSDPAATESLADFTTCQALGFGKHYIADSVEDVAASLHQALAGLNPVPQMRGINTAVLVFDCSQAMAEPLATGEASPIELISAGVRRYIEDKTIPPSNLALAYSKAA